MNNFSFNNLKLVHWIVIVGLSIWSIQSAGAQSCQAFKLSSESIERWYNPHPSFSDFELPMPLGMALVFSPIPLGTESLFGDEKLTYVMGSSNLELFETNLQVRVGSSISSQGESHLLFGKYEVSKAQYVAVMGNGVLDVGVRVLAEKSRDPNAQQVLSKFTSGRCKGVLTREMYDFLSEPLTFLSYRDYIEFLDTYNAYCISRNNCRRKLFNLGPNRDVPGFVRLPAEHEWEFVARGGQELVAGSLNYADFQNDLPATQSTQTITNYAHVGSDPPRLLPIGSRKPLFGIYDMLGNAQELMLDPFTSENGFGAVGAYVARGGHFRLAPKELRVAKRVELQVFRLDESTKSIVVQYFPLTGIRTVIGYPVIGAAQRLGDKKSIQRDFEENYEPPGESGDKAGDTPTYAHDLGEVGDRGVFVTEELSNNDTVDYFKVSLKTYSRMTINLSSDVSMLYEVVNKFQRTVSQGRSGVSSQNSPALMPGDYWIKMTPVNQLKMEKRYRVDITRSLVPDTGIEELDPIELSRNAQSVSSSSGVLDYSGYVGSGDTVDIYPIRDGSRVGGIELELDEFSAPVELTYVNENLNIVRSIQTESNNGKLVMFLNSEYDRSGFVQVSASPNAATTYKLRVSVRSPYQKNFVQSVSSAVNSYSSENVNYKGNLDQFLPVLYLPIQIEEPKILKVELTGLSADADLRILNSDKTELQSLYVRDGISPEFFSKLVDSGVYFAEVRLKSTRESSQFNLLHTAEILPSNAFASNRATPSRPVTEVLGILNKDGIEKNVVLQDDTTYYRFAVSDPSHFVWVSISNPHTSNVNNPDLYLEDDQGSVLARGKTNLQNETELGIALKQGTYYLRLELDRNATLVTLFKISLSIGASKTTAQIPSMKNPDLSRFGTLIESSGDFQIYRSRISCTLVTVAEQMSPSSGWRSNMPYFYISVNKNTDTIFMSIDQTSPKSRSKLYLAGSVKAKLLDEEIPTKWSHNHLLPIVGWHTSSWGNIVSFTDMSKSAIEGFAKGRTLIISGLTPNNQATRIEYSLLGYTRAAQRINQLCKADADWIWKPPPPTAFSARDPDLSKFGKLVEKSEDYQIFREGRSCTLVTVAKLISPNLGWRSVKPYFYIRVSSNRDKIYMSIDDTQPETRHDLYKGGSVRAYIPTFVDIPIRWRGNVLSHDSSLSLSKGEMSGITREGFIEGIWLIIQGRTPSNKEVRIEYSLIGFQRAAKRINELCSADADWIWKLPASKTPPKYSDLID